MAPGPGHRGPGRLPAQASAGGSSFFHVCSSLNSSYGFVSCSWFFVLGSSFFFLDSCFLIPCSFFFLRLLKAQKVAKIDHSVIFFSTGPRAEWVAQSSRFFELCGS